MEYLFASWTGALANAQGIAAFSRGLCWLCLAAVVGCSNSPPAIDPPDIEPASIAAAAISQYDANGDQIIDESELANAPSLSFSADRIDVNADGQMTSEEIEQFVETHWVESGSGLIRLKCRVMMNGQPVDGATVVFEPEQFMGGAIVPASGVTQGGTARIDVADEDRPDSNAHGAQNGLYLVRISYKQGGQELIPAKYNTETTLGCEVAKRASYLPGPVVFALSP